MKNVIKKISAIAMAFTLLGTGTAVTKAINPKSNNALVANAACKHNKGGYYDTGWQWAGNGTDYYWLSGTNTVIAVHYTLERREVKSYCTNCGQVYYDNVSYRKV